MINREIISKELYGTYCKAVGGIAFNSDPLPNWVTFLADHSRKSNLKLGFPLLTEQLNC